MSPLPTPGAPASGLLRIVLIGDIVGKPGMRIACTAVPWLREKLLAKLIVANAENAADGSGLRCRDFRRLCEHGVDAITLGDHVYRKREIIEVLETEHNIVRPANLPSSAPGKSQMTIELENSVKVGIVAALGRVFMKPVDCPFQAVDRELDRFDASVRIRLVDFHAEATSDKQLMGRYLDGRASAMLGTHTHVATADEQLFAGGTAYQTDVGMTGPFDSILGRRTEAVMEATLSSLPVPFQVAKDDVRMNATWFDVDPESGKSLAIGRLDLSETSLIALQQAKQAMPKLL